MFYTIKFQNKRVRRNQYQSGLSLQIHVHFLAFDSPTHSTLGVIFPFPVIVKKAMMGRMTAVREMTFNNYTVLRTKLNAR